jgi:hypothetical protein
MKKNYIFRLKIDQYQDIWGLRTESMWKLCSKIIFNLSGIWKFKKQNCQIQVFRMNKNVVKSCTENWGKTIPQKKGCSTISAWFVGLSWFWNVCGNHRSKIFSSIQRSCKLKIAGKLKKGLAGVFFLARSDPGSAGTWTNESCGQYWPYLRLFARPCGQNRLNLGFNSMVDDIWLEFPRSAVAVAWIPLPGKVAAP